MELVHNSVIEYSTTYFRGEVKSLKHFGEGKLYYTCHLR